MGPILRAFVATCVLALALARPTHAGVPLAWALVSDQTPARLCSDLTTDIDVEVRNDGEETWSDAAGDRLAYHWRDATGAVAEFEGERTRLPEAVSPGKTVRLRARVRPPGEPGEYKLQWAMVRENVRWFPRPEGRADQRDVVVAGPAFRWSLDDAEAPAALGGGERATASLTITNHGCETWREEDGDRMSYRWTSSTGEPVAESAARTSWPGAVPPGATVRVDAIVEAPPRPGTYGLQWEPVREGKRWYGPPLDGRRRHAVEVTSPTLWWSLLEVNPAPAVGAGDELKVRVVVRNDGTAAWSPGAGDALGTHWRTPAGEVVVAEGGRTPLPFEVAPGHHVEVTVVTRAPRTPGDYDLRLEPVREGTRWMGHPAEGEWDVPVYVGAPALAFEVVELAAPGTIAVGRTDEAWVTVRNTGARGWSPGLGDHVSYHWLEPDSGAAVVHDGLRTPIPHDVAPGETVSLVMAVRGPPRAGRFRFQPDVVREHVRWFGPAQGASPGPIIAARRNATAVAIVVLLLAILTLVLARRRDRWAGLCAASVCIVGVAALQMAFVERAMIEPWPGAIWVVLCLGALGAALVVAVPGQFRGAVVFVWIGAAAMVLIADLAYLHFFGTIVPLSALAASHQLVDVRASIGSLTADTGAAVWLTLAAAVLVGLGGHGPGLTRRTRRLVLLALLVLAAPGAGRLARATSGTLGTRVFSETDNVKRFGLHGAHAFALVRRLGHADREPLPDGGVRAVRAWFEERASEVAPSSHAGTVAGSNVIFVQAEALQQWVLDAEVGGEPVMPFLSRWHHGGLTFDHVFDQTNQGNTSDAEYAVLASQHPMAEGALAFLRADAGFVTLAHTLRAAGYATLSAHPFARGFWNRSVLHPRYGFDESLFRRELGAGPNVGWGLSDGAFFERVLPHLTRLRRPFFAFLVTLSLHHPYPDFPDALEELELGDMQDTPLGNYLHSMRYLDRSLEAFIGGLADAGLLQRSVVVVYGDHDARLDPSPELTTLAGIEEWDPSAEARLDRVPVLVRVPGRPLTGRRSRLGGHVDIAPTVLDLLGLARPMGFVGTSLLTQSGRPVALRHGGAAAVDRIYVAHGDEIPDHGGCFDFPVPRSRPRADCEAARQAVGEELARSRAVLDHDLFGELAGATGGP